MFDRKRTASVLVTACAICIGLGAAFDRDLMFLPFQSEAKRLEREQPGILAALKDYNSIITDIYVTSGAPKMLSAIPATKAIRHDLYRDIGYIRDHQQVLVYDMANMVPVSVRLTSLRTAEAVVFEEWNYQYQRAADRSPASRLKGIGQGFKYRLTKEDGRWVISSWDPVEVEDPVKAPQRTPGE